MPHVRARIVGEIHDEGDLTLLIQADVEDVHHPLAEDEISGGDDLLERPAPADEERRSCFDLRLDGDHPRIVDRRFGDRANLQPFDHLTLMHHQFDRSIPDAKEIPSPAHVPDEEQITTAVSDEARETEEGAIWGSRSDRVQERLRRRRSRVQPERDVQAESRLVKGAG